jgi:hypothetical protein
VDKAQKELNDAYTALYEAQGKVNSGDTSVNSGDTSVDSATIDKLRSDLNNKINAWEDASAALVKWELSQPGDSELSHPFPCEKRTGMCCQTPDRIQMPKQPSRS